MPRRPEDPSLRANGAIELSELAAGVADAVLGAKLRLDEHAAVVADQYRASPALSILSPPVFAIGEVRVVIKFAVAQIERAASAQRKLKDSPSQVRVHVAAESLAEIAPHLISEIELRIAPEMKRAQPTEIGRESPA